MQWRCHAGVAAEQFRYNTTSVVDGEFVLGVLRLQRGYPRRRLPCPRRKAPVLRDLTWRGHSGAARWMDPKRSPVNVSRLRRATRGIPIRLPGFRSEERRVGKDDR